MDIIVKLAECGVPLAVRDRAGHTASFRACNELEVPFLQGAILLGEEDVTRPHSQTQLASYPGSFSLGEWEEMGLGTRLRPGAVPRLLH